METQKVTQHSAGSRRGWNAKPGGFSTGGERGQRLSPACPLPGAGLCQAIGGGTRNHTHAFSSPLSLNNSKHTHRLPSRPHQTGAGHCRALLPAPGGRGELMGTSPAFVASGHSLSARHFWLKEALSLKPRLGDTSHLRLLTPPFHNPK